MSTIGNQPFHGNCTTLNYLIDSQLSQNVYLEMSEQLPFVDFINSIAGNNIETDHSFSTRQCAIFKNCDKIGNITAVGMIILKNCPNHGRVVSQEGDIHVLNSNTDNLFPGAGKKIYVYVESDKKNIRKKLF